MSGAEAIAVLGLISSVITIIETSRDLFDAAASKQGLHEAFRMVSQNIPLVLNILRDCRKIQTQVEHDYKTSNDVGYKQEIEESAKAVKPTIIACQEDAQKLSKIFEEVLPGDDAKWLERYRKAAQTVMPGKKRKVEELMKEMLEKLQLLHISRFFKSETDKRSAELEAAIRQLAELPSSLLEDESRFHHSGSGSLNVSEREQYNYYQSGGSNNKQYNGHTFHFGKE